MAIQYSGLTIINTTFTCTTGTRLEIVNGLSAALLSAGWTQISGAGTGTQTFKSATTPQGYSIRVVVTDPGSGNTAQFYIGSGDGTLMQSGYNVCLYPTAGAVWRVIASAYQFFIFVPVSSGVANYYARWGAGGVPYVLPFLTGMFNWIGFTQGSSRSDSEITGNNAYGSWRGGGANGSGNQSVLWNGFYNPPGWSGQGGSSCPTFVVPMTYGSNTVKYADSSVMIADPWILMGPQWNSGFSGLTCQLWDACFVCDSFNGDTTGSWDSHNWFCISMNVGSPEYCSLFVAIP